MMLSVGSRQTSIDTPHAGVRRKGNMEAREVVNYWIGVVSRSHIEIGVRGGFMQFNHGKRAPVQRLKAGDYIAVYSPRTDYPDGEQLQAFTALGKVTTGTVYQVKMSDDFKPYRVDVEFFPCTPAPIRPLIATLSFIKNKQSWGSAFMFGQLKVSPQDFLQVSKAMGVEVQSAA
jgi:EVE domain